MGPEMESEFKPRERKKRRIINPYLLFVIGILMIIAVMTAFFIKACSGDEPKKETKKIVQTTTEKSAGKTVERRTEKTETTEKEAPVKKTVTPLPQTVLDLGTVRFNISGRIAYAVFKIRWSEHNAQVPPLLVTRFARMYPEKHIENWYPVLVGDGQDVYIVGMYITFR